MEAAANPKAKYGDKMIKKKKSLEKWRTRVSFSASLPDDICEAFADSICVVKHSTDPISDIRQSILEMIRTVGVRDWAEMEELVYCYIVLNSSEIHKFIEDAFLSVCSRSAGRLIRGKNSKK
ncbi:hypothetical protein U1Q18_031902 [Sarracenia purpurea var. burkii]